MRRLAIVALAPACNQVLGLEPTHVRVDARPIDAPGCVDAVWNNPTAIGDLAGLPAEYEPQLSHDLRELWFERSGGGKNIYRARRDAPDLPFQTAQLESFDQATSEDEGPSLTGDGLRLVFVSNRIGERAVFEAERSELGGQFTIVRQLTGVPRPDNQTSVDISFDGRTLYYAMNGELWSLARPALDAPFETPMLRATGVGYPSVSPDQLEVYFNTPGTSRPLKRLVRTSPLVAFEPTEAIVSNDGEDPDLANDGRTMIAANADGLIVLERDCP